jgi:predicted dehydrogenase
MGAHARTKLIPALAENGQELTGVVTTRPAAAPEGVLAFADLHSALSELPADTVFLVATPPSVHFDQVQQILTSGRDVIVEKPAFVTRDEASQMAALAEKYGGVLVEAFMHHHTALYRRLVEFWNSGRDEVGSIEIDFLIPAVPTDTFRQSHKLAASLLYDVGCYAVALMADLGLPLEALRLTEVENAGLAERESYRLEARAAGRTVVARIGIGAEYRNQVALHMVDGTTASFRPFFYGRSGEKIVEGFPAGEAERFEDANAFEAMLAVPRSAWVVNQPDRLARMVAVTGCLEVLGSSLADWRRRAGQA